MLTVVCWKWTPPAGYRSTFGPETVNVLRRMVARHYSHPHRFVCLTNDTAGLDREVEALPLWDDGADIPSPHGNGNPSCYRRLKAFAPEMRELLGPRFVSLDLDCVIVGDLTPVWQRDEAFVIWGHTHPSTTYNASMFLMTAGAKREVWERFDPTTSPARARSAQCFGSDQGWISYVLGPHEARWSRADGVYSYQNDARGLGRLPTGARIVFFHGPDDPWMPHVQARDRWVAEHWN